MAIVGARAGGVREKGVGEDKRQKMLFAIDKRCRMNFVRAGVLRASGDEGAERSVRVEGVVKEEKSDIRLGG